MSTNKHNADEILDQAVDIADPTERQAFLNEACAGDKALRAEVDSLLAAYAKSGSFLDGPPVNADVTLDAVPTPDMTGTEIGRYKLLEKIGEGGMAVVYMAEQRHPIARRVAVKLIKLGMDTQQVIARFEAERQALALMDHPNIAKVFDAGSTDTGRPYFVMELVKGMAITEFCDSNHLTAQERLELFISVCQAVQHAHQRGIIHRDIKPSNVLVTLHDGKPVVKVIDFGIAKAVNQRLTEKTLFTHFSQMIGTPEYMSPEQAEMSGLDIDTRTDVFSLGVLLYELLTGATPFGSEYLLSKGYNEMQRIIREEEPVKPSTRVSTLGDSLADIAKHRRTSPELLSKLIRSDLDWIVMKTLEKDRGRRYESVSELAADVRRHIANEPVLAGRPSAIYKLQKFIKRNKVLVTAVTSIVVVVVLATIISTVLAITATQARRVAVEANMEAKDAESRAVRSKQREEALRKEREEDLYLELIDSASQALVENKPVHALDSLDRCQDRFKENWEWRYLYRKCHFLDAPSLEFGVDVLSFAYNPDDSTIALYNANGQLVILDHMTGKELHRHRICRDLKQLRIDYRNPNRPLMDFSHGGKSVAVIGDNSDVCLISIETGETLRSFENAGTVSWLDCSPRGNLLATASIFSTVRLWDRESGKLLREHACDRVVRVAFSPDGERLFVDRWLAPIEVYNVGDLLSAEGDARPTAQFESMSYGLVMTTDGQRLATVLYDHSIRIMDGQYNEIARLRGHIDHVSSFAFNADGTRLVSSSADGTTRLWDTETGREVLLFRISESVHFHVQFGSEDELILGDRTRALQVLDASDLAESPKDDPLLLPAPSGLMMTVGYNPVGSQLLSSGLDSDVRLWNAVTGGPICSVGGHKSSWNVQFSSDGQLIASAGIIEDSRFVVEVWDAYPPHDSRFLAYLDEEPWGLTFSADSQKIIVGLGPAPGRLQVFDVNAKEEIGVLGQHDAVAVEIYASRDGKYVASTHTDGSVKLWDAKRIGELQEDPNVFEWEDKHLFGAAFSPDSSRLAFGGPRGEIRIVDVESREAVLTIPEAHGDGVIAVSFSPNGKYLASCSFDQTVRVWDTQTGDLIDILLEHKGPLHNVTFSPDGRHVASAGYDEKMLIWEPNLK